MKPDHNDNVSVESHFLPRAADLLRVAYEIASDYAGCAHFKILVLC